MPSIKKIGTLMYADIDGYLGNVSQMKKIPSKWRPVVDAVVDAARTHFKNNLLSIYLRGGLPKGEAIDGVSDVDCIAVLKGSPLKGSVIWREEKIKEIEENYPFVHHVELDTVLCDEVMNKAGMTVYRFTLKHLAVRLWGEEVDMNISPFKPDRRIAFHFYGNLPEVLAFATKKMAGENDPETIKRGCAWIMKRLLRTGYGLVMEREGAFTRDLYPCWEVFSKYYPEKKHSMKEILEYAVNPIEDKIKIMHIIRDMGGWLYTEWRKVFSTST